MTPFEKIATGIRDAILASERLRERPDKPGTRVAFYAWELSEEWIEALKNADYGHLPDRHGSPTKSRERG